MAKKKKISIKRKDVLRKIAEKAADAIFNQFEGHSPQKKI